MPLAAFLAGISLVCFLASYVTALALELGQVLRKQAWWHWGALAFAAAGFLAHTLYLFRRSAVADLPPLLSSKHDWLLVLAWLAVLLYLFVELLDRRITLGLFVLPLVLAFVVASRFVSPATNAPLGSLRGLGLFHAAMLVFGAVGVCAGLVSSAMYLVQHRRLKRKLAGGGGVQLFSLEMLGRMNWWTVMLSVPLLTLGMATGVWLTFLSAATTRPVSLGRGEFLASGVVWLAMCALFVWMLTARQPAGKLIAWRTLWACGFMLTTFVVLQLLSPGMHGR